MLQPKTGLIFWAFLFAALCSLPLRAQAQMKSYELWYNAPAPMLPITALDSLNKNGLVEATPLDPAWENWSLPLGNGYFGASVFGRTITERIQLTQNSMAAKSLYGGAGLTNFGELYIDFNHATPQQYRRSLNIGDAISTVAYQQDGVLFERNYFASYPDKVMVIQLKANQKAKLSFTLRPEIPYKKNFGAASNFNGREGKVVAANDVITLAGKLEYLNILFEGQFKVVPFGGTMQAINDANGANGKIIVANADSAIILIAVGTNYKLDGHIFTENNSRKKLTDTTPPHQQVLDIIEGASAKTYAQLWAAHQKDYHRLFDRVKLDLGAAPSLLPTDILLKNYKQDIVDHYLEELFFQYGRYLLICSSRPGTLPPNLQGIWNQYDIAPWTGGYWHNINIQMNYWPAFNTNLTELFQSFSDYNLAYRNAATLGATQYVQQYNPQQLSSDGENGWTIGTGANAYGISTPGGHSGPGTGAMTTKLFWDYYAFTGNKKYLKTVAYPALMGMSKFLSKVVKDTAGLLLASPSYSPEQRAFSDNLHYKTTGCAFDQQMIFENHHDVLEAAKILNDKNPLLPILQNQLPQLDPVQIGWSGQIKEYREEKYYGDLVADKKHRHTSQLVGLYPGTMINSTTPAWLDAAKVSLNSRGDKATGWAMAHRLNLWARAKDGDHAYLLYKNLLQKGVLDNLWDAHPPFQIDGNFGGSAGVAEMLLQSHEGYIDVLPALPQQWSTGTFKGLLARGNFEIDARWKNNQANQLVVKANIGGTCKLKYYNIHKAIVKNAAGKIITTSSVRPDFISFHTQPGTVYTITAIAPYHAVANPFDLVIAQNNSGNIVAQWKPSAGAVAYNVYVHFGDSPNYTMVQSKLKSTSITYRISKENAAQHCILKVAAVDKIGRESSGVIINANDGDNSINKN